jgi:hypothetical protein
MTKEEDQCKDEKDVNDGASDVIDDKSTDPRKEAKNRERKKYESHERHLRAVSAARSGWEQRRFSVRRLRAVQVKSLIVVEHYRWHEIPDQQETAA